MRAKGLSEKEVLKKLKQAHEKDSKYKNGKIFCSMCSIPYPLAKTAHNMFLESNLGDPGLFSGSLQLEKEAIAKLIELLHGTKSSNGFIVSGGTEANLLAMYAARKAAKVDAPEVVASDLAHFSLEKICDLLKIKLIKAELNESYTVDPKKIEEHVNENTVAIVGNAGSAELGTIDPIEDLSKTAIKWDIPLHVDAAFGGLVIPFLKELGYSVGEFDFQIKGVQSITVDPHKMGMSTIPAGGILFRDSIVLKFIKTETPYLTEDFQCTFVGTRSAASAAATWAVFESLGREGFQKTVAHCMNLTTLLYEGLEELGFEVLFRPMMNIVAFRTKNTKLLNEKLQKGGWQVSYIPRFDCLRAVLMPHTTSQHVRNFLQRLRELSKDQ